MPTNTYFAAKVLVVSTSLMTGPLWAFSLEGQRFTVVTEANPLKTLRRWAEEVPNLILLDINAQAPTVLNMVRNLREESVVPVLLLTSNKPEEYILEAYDAGVDECIIKPISASMFQAKIKAWLRRSWSVPMYALDPLKVGKVRLIPDHRAVTIDSGPQIRLTNLELRLLYILMSRPGRPVSTDELIQRIWGYGKEADSSVLKNLMYRLRRKIEADGANSSLIETVPAIGYKFLSD